MKIGVTGIYASGKGTVCEIFSEFGAKIIDTDIVAREIVEPGSEGLSLLIEEFGKEILDETGFLDRRRLANTVFKDPEKVNWLNEITHPLILKQVFDTIQSNPNDIYMINTPLLYESGFDKLMDKNIVVFANVDQVIERGIKRDSLTEIEINDRLKNQISLNEKIEKADYVIDNTDTIEKTRRQVTRIWNALMKEPQRE